MAWLFRFGLGIFLTLTLLSNKNLCTHRQADLPQHGPSTPSTGFIPDSAFKQYWYKGEAELAVYDIQQQRYGELHEGQQVLVFVTEDFSKAKQVKLDYPNQYQSDRLPILKMNAIRRFQTGIYDYSAMQSVYTAVKNGQTVKQNISVQDWCGHVYTQFNLEGNQYRLTAFSYFEMEGDSSFLLPVDAHLESGLWTQLRLDPMSIPTGVQKLIPDALFLRLEHKPVEAREATISRKDVPNQPNASILEVSYPESGRVLEIKYDRSFPYQIQSWEERYQNKVLSKGTLRRTQKSAYWELHNSWHMPLRDSLQVEF